MTNIELYQKIFLAAGEMDATPTDGQIADFVNRLSTYGIQIVSTKEQVLNAAAEKQDSDISIESYQDGSGDLHIESYRGSVELHGFKELNAKLDYLISNVIAEDDILDDIGEEYRYKG
jgi:hypothetical protein